MAHQVAVESEHVIAEVVEITAFPELARRYDVTSVPKAVFNDSTELVGSQSEERFLAALTLVASR